VRRAAHGARARPARLDVSRYKPLYERPVSLDSGCASADVLASVVRSAGRHRVAAQSRSNKRLGHRNLAIAPAAFATKAM
jgi:hypothetical protein